MPAPFRFRKNDHRKKVFIPDPRSGNRIFSPKELAKAINDQTVLNDPLPPITPQERLEGWAVGWKRTVTCTARTGSGKFAIVSSLEEWTLGKWPRQM